MKSRMESCACASLETKWLQGWLQIMLTQELAMPRVVAFDVSSLITHIHTHGYLYLSFHTGTRGHLSPCSVAGHTSSSTNYWPVRTWVLGVGLSPSISCVCRTAQLLLLLPSPVCQTQLPCKLWTPVAFHMTSWKKIPPPHVLSCPILSPLWNILYKLEEPNVGVGAHRFFAIVQHTLAHPGSQCGYLVTILDKLLAADVGHDPSSQRVPQHIDHCSKPVSAKWNSDGEVLALWVNSCASISCNYAWRPVLLGLWAKMFGNVKKVGIRHPVVIEQVIWVLQPFLSLVCCAATHLIV